MDKINAALTANARPIGFFKPDPDNARLHPDASIKAIASSLDAFGQNKPVVCLTDGTVIAGNGMLTAALRLGWTRLAAVTFDDAVRAKAYAVADNRTAEHSQWDPEQLAASLRNIADSGISLEQVGFDADALKSIIVAPHLRTLLSLGDGPASGDPTPPINPDTPPEQPPEVVSLAERFIVPPFTILDTRQGYWQDRKRRWLAMGIASELGRTSTGSVVPTDGDGTLLIDQYRERNVTPGGSGGGAWLGGRKTASSEKFQNTKRLTYVKGDRPVEELDEVSRKIVGTGTGTSIFDPVLCELVYRWFSPPGGLVLDPFAGGSVRGVVAGILGRAYHGIELRAEQVAANRDQIGIAPKEASITWVCGDSREHVPTAPEADLVFSCPPYADLEVYSDDPRDISNMSHADFRAAHAEIIAKACARLKPNRFAVWVIGDVRDRNGNYLGLINDTINAFRDAGMALYNEAILVNAVGSLPIRAGRMFTISRKMGKTHQNVLVFLKGDARAAVADLGTVEVDDFDGGEEDTPVTVEPVTPVDVPDNTPDLTPVERVGAHYVKRDDTFAIAGVAGGKVRSCWRLAQGATGLVTAGSRSSPQVNIVAHIAKRMGIPCRVHTPSGTPSPEVEAAVLCGAERVEHVPGHNSVIVSRARKDAVARGWREIPFGMECAEAVEETSRQVDNIPPDAKRIVVPVGSGMSLAGILAGMRRVGRTTPVLGVVVGADPAKRLDQWAPAGWRDMVTLVRSPDDYHVERSVRLGGIVLDPVYEAKCAPFLEDGDCLWVVGVRATVHAV